MMHSIKTSEKLKRKISSLLVSLMIIQIAGCVSSKGLKKENPKKLSCEEKYKMLNGDYNTLLNDFEILTEMENDCYQLNKKFAKELKVNSDLIRELNKEYKKVKGNELIMIIVVSSVIGLLVGGTVAGVAVKYTK